jgi:aldos-2-ulose dehydratase
MARYVTLVSFPKSITYDLLAWLAGSESKKKGENFVQSFDVWLAFEFPPFIADVVTSTTGSLVPEGTYKIVNPATQLTLTVKDGSSTDNTPLVASTDAQPVSLHTRNVVLSF